MGIIISAEYQEDIARLTKHPVVRRMSENLREDEDLEGWSFIQQADNFFRNHTEESTTHIGAVAAAIRKIVAEDEK